MPQGMIRVMVSTDKPAIPIQTLYSKSLKRSTVFFMCSPLRRQTGQSPPPRRYRTDLLDGFNAGNQVFVSGTVFVAYRLGGVVERFFLFWGKGDELNP